jgi:coenzyme PQQ synthesis protein D (PqqD)
VSTVGPPVPGVRWQDLDGRVVAFNPATGRAAALNETATEIWKLADGSREEADVVAELAQRYAVDLDTIKADVLSTISQLRAEGLLPTGPPT